jgi:hypothetical protein
MPRIEKVSDPIRERIRISTPDRGVLRPAKSDPRDPEQQEACPSVRIRPSFEMTPGSRGRG